MQTATISFDRFNQLQDDACHQRIRTARGRLGKEVVLLCHHYQRADVYQYADLTGDSLKLSRLAANTDSRFIVFCGVHFMAEVADIMSKPQQIAILPDLAAGCSMADMANLAKVERCWRELGELIDVDQLVTPVTYINSAADLKAFCGEHGGIVCTSSNAGTIATWAFARREKILFFPDQHLGRWTGFQMGIPLDEMVVWDPDLERGGLTPQQIRDARLLLWKGHCSVHQMFQPAHILRFRNQHPDGLVISHPECSFEVCRQSDFVGSTEHIVRTIKEASANTRWLVGTELNLVNRLAEEVRHEGKIVQFMAPTVCMCSTMQRIDPQHLAWTLENLAEGTVVNQISVPEHERELARLALDRMLEVS
ncbi:MAG: Quinolinate synthase A [Candidatus Accumulibacter sp. BA-94]|jgi:quinolinate synthase|uniref:quinolinate synthase NadA n=1 Tax=Accumulibacter sp. TaxID=2053492 RepID=UPI00044B98C5|nr:quinolinate synthase NadA [Accumulibacter sp.]EXI87211.1 MAG: Quinolinate synthase A [Candidatus Accumulibacter sp. BA-94]MBL8393058.1 quinolinate synthase NadA [Accumulibacter sp.]HRD87554.1 quinolinate synthase NadA [Accumulibacter sp.]